MAAGGPFGVVARIVEIHQTGQGGSVEGNLEQMAFRALDHPFCHGEPDPALCGRENDWVRKGWPTLGHGDPDPVFGPVFPGDRPHLLSQYPLWLSQSGEKGTGLKKGAWEAGVGITI